MQPSRGCIVKKTEGGASSAEGGTRADARPSAPRAAGRSSAPPGRGQAAQAVFRQSGMARIRRMRGAPQAGRAARRQARTPTERPNAPVPRAAQFAPLPTHRCGKGRSAKRTRPKPICRLASAADASETALSARSERLGRSATRPVTGTPACPPTHVLPHTTPTQPQRLTDYPSHLHPSSPSHLPPSHLSSATHAQNVV